MTQLHLDLLIALRPCRATNIWEQCDCAALDEVLGVSELIIYNS